MPGIVTAADLSAVILRTTFAASKAGIHSLSIAKVSAEASVITDTVVDIISCAAADEASVPFHLAGDGRRASCQSSCYKCEGEAL